jgi:hypothetical protein
VLLSHLQKFGYDEALAQEAHEVLAHVDKLQPGQPRFAQLMEQLAALAPQEEESGDQPAEDEQAAAA